MLIKALRSWPVHFHLSLFLFCAIKTDNVLSEKKFWVLFNVIENFNLIKSKFDRLIVTLAFHSINFIKNISVHTLHILPIYIDYDDLLFLAVCFLFKISLWRHIAQVRNLSALFMLLEFLLKNLSVWRFFLSLSLSFLLLMMKSDIKLLEVLNCWISRFLLWTIYTKRVYVTGITAKAPF